MGPQIIWIVLMGACLGIALNQHGKEKQGNHNVVFALVAVAIHVILLWKGGFWDCFK